MYSHIDENTEISQSGQNIFYYNSDKFIVLTEDEIYENYCEYVMDNVIDYIDCLIDEYPDFNIANFVSQSYKDITFANVSNSDIKKKYITSAINDAIKKSDFNVDKFVKYVFAKIDDYEYNVLSYEDYIAINSDSNGNDWYIYPIY